MFCLWVCQVVFPRVLRFSPHLPIDSSQKLERDVKLNQKKKKNIYIYLYNIMNNILSKFKEILQYLYM